MVYFCAENNLAKYAVHNLNMMLRVGSSEDVALLALADLPEGGAKRYHFGRPFTRPEIEPLGAESDIGDLSCLIRFLRWGFEKCPAERYCVVIWGHAAGWDEAEECRVTFRQTLANQSFRGRRRRRNAQHAEDGEPDVDLAETGLGFRKDFFNNFELKRTFALASEHIGRKIDVLGFDACLMGMSEVAGQVKDAVDTFVASVAEVPVESWPYDKILSDLQARPCMSGAELSRAIVARYVEHYTLKQHGLPETRKTPVALSALDLTKYDALTAAAKDLGAVLKERIEAEDEFLGFALRASLSRTLSYYANSYVDLYDFCDALDCVITKRFDNLIHDGSAERIQAACARVKEVIEKEKFVLHTGFYGAAFAKSRGVSVFLPMISRCYSRLQFAKATEWDKFLESFVASSFKDVDIQAVRAMRRHGGPAGARRS